MGGQNLNCKKKWHPSRYETRTKVEAAEKEQSETERELEKRSREEPVYTKKEGAEKIRMPWMVQGFGDEKDEDLESRFEL